MYIKHPNLIKIGKKIQESRKSKGYSQESFAYAAGIARTYMGRVKRGEQNISIQNLIKIALKLKVEVGDLIPTNKAIKIKKLQRLFYSYCLQYAYK